MNAHRIRIRHAIEMEVLGRRVTKAGFDPNQPRNPHTGEWIGVGHPLKLSEAKVGARVVAVISAETGEITAVRDTTTGQKWAVKVKWDPIPDHPLGPKRRGEVEGWVSNPALNLQLVEKPA